MHDCQSVTPGTHMLPYAGTCILFGDGCGAIVMTAAPADAPCNLLGVDMHSDGAGQKSLYAKYSGEGGKPYADGHASAHATYGNIAMQGQEVFKFAVRSVPQVSCLHKSC